MSSFPRVASFKSPDAFRTRLAALQLNLPCDSAILPAPDSPLAQPLDVDGFRIGNRWVIHPMEGWDAEPDGQPSEYVRARWRNFGRSGAKWIWGGEAMAVVPEGRANPNQVIIQDSTRDALARLLEETVETHRAEVGNGDDLLIGFQLTHSGRFCKPWRKDKMEPRILYTHPVLNRKFRLGEDYPVMGDDEIWRIIDRFIAAARIAESCGARFVDVKHCHGYLGHEFLSAHTRPGPFGGAFENRTRFLREITAGIRAATRLAIGVRLSAFDWVAFRPDPAGSSGNKLGPGIPEEAPVPYRYGFGTDPENPVAYDLTEPRAFLALCRELGIRMINVSCGSPYYVPHIQRPALFPPSDGYQPPEDPLVGCARQIAVTEALKKDFPDLILVGTGYSYLQEYLPHVAQAVVRSGGADAVGLGRMVLSYPTLPKDTLESGKMTHNRICRTFSDCTTAPRNGLISGCYPLDPVYKSIPEADQLKQIKASLR
ncbi:MAG: NADH:flavin oxidoreductase [Acidobacteria bacterium]|nr:NADH:flavin oxidoreductase [Acidobacteriota bacterium]